MFKHIYDGSQQQFSPIEKFECCWSISTSGFAFKERMHLSAKVKSRKAAPEAVCVQVCERACVHKYKCVFGGCVSDWMCS